jgi:hypothetical protein
MKTFAEFVIEAKKKRGLDDPKPRQMEPGFTGGPIPTTRWKSAAKRHEWEKKRRESLKKKPGEPDRLMDALKKQAEREGQA